MSATEDTYGSVYRKKMKEIMSEPFKPLNVREESKGWPNWVVFAGWCVFWLLIGVLAVFAFDKLERLVAVRWPSL